MVDEWTLCSMVPNAADILRQHWDSWVTLADFQKIAKSGFNTVRIPIGCKHHISSGMSSAEGTDEA